jgi:Rrf2 family protein
MKISTRTYYGIQSLAYLSAQNRQCTLADIVRHEHIPEVYLEKILQKLRKNGIVASKKGFRGGYALAQDPKSITLAQIFAILEGPTVTAPCLQNKRCQQKASCHTRQFWQTLERSISQQLSKITLADIIHKS